MIASRTDQHKEYLNMLSAISSKLKQKITREQILNSIDKEFIWEGNKDTIESTDNPFVVQFINGLSEGPIN